MDNDAVTQLIMREEDAVIVHLVGQRRANQWIDLVGTYLTFCTVGIIPGFVSPELSMIAMLSIWPLFVAMSLKSWRVIKLLVLRWDLPSTRCLCCWC